MAKPCIMVAPNGARRSKADHPALPITPAEIATDALACYAAGADALHLHVRDADGIHSLDPGLYRAALTLLSEAVPAMPVQITTEAAGRFDLVDQIGCLSDLAPDWASVAVREAARDPTLAARLYAVAHDGGTRIQHILYDADDAAMLEAWQESGIVRPDQRDALLVLGRYESGAPSGPAAIAGFKDALPPSTDWMLCAFGPQEHACLLEAARLGGALRVGFENSLEAPDGTRWRDNAASVAALCTALTETSARRP